MNDENTSTEIIPISYNTYRCICKVRDASGNFKIAKDFKFRIYEPTSSLIAKDSIIEKTYPISKESIIEEAIHIEEALRRMLKLRPDQKIEFIQDEDENLESKFKIE